MSDLLYLKGTLEFVTQHYDSYGGPTDPPNAAKYDPEKPIDVQTEKENGKLVPCTECSRAIFVNTFYAPAIAKCSDCRPDEIAAPKAPGTQAVVQAGRTDPAKAANLADTLINPHFGFARCPVHPDDPEHEMELKSVNHNERYGPSTLIGYDARGRPNYRQDGAGETVMHQCLRCKAIVSYTTTAQTQMRRVNEPTNDEMKQSNGWATLLGSREEEPASAA